MINAEFARIRAEMKNTREHEKYVRKYVKWVLRKIAREARKGNFSVVLSLSEEIQDYLERRLGFTVMPYEPLNRYGLQGCTIGWGKEPEPEEDFLPLHLSSGEEEEE